MTRGRGGLLFPLPAYLLEHLRHILPRHTTRRHSHTPSKLYTLFQSMKGTGRKHLAALAKLSN